MADLTPTASSKSGKKRRLPSALQIVGEEPERAEQEDMMLQEADLVSLQSATTPSTIDSAASKLSRSSTKTKIVRSLPDRVELELLMRQETFQPHLVDRLLEYSAGFNTVPAHLLEFLRATYPEDLALRHVTAFYPGLSRARLAGVEFWPDNINLVCNAAEGCRLRQGNEAAWDSQVHGLLLQLACFCSKYCGAVGATNIFSSRLNHAFLPFMPQAGPR